MDFLDPKKQRQHAILLYAGYIFIGIAVIISTMVLLYQANGFGVNSKGQVVQSGLVFVSSQPNPTKIYLNGKLDDAQTNARLSLSAGQYNVRLSRDGYRDWVRRINVQGGDVQNYDYPFLFPVKLDSSAEADYTTAPGVATQSRDRRWLVVQQGATATFDVYDLKEKKLAATPLTLPTSIVSTAAGAQTWEAQQWANDAQHFLLKHTNGASVEFLLVDRENPDQSINLSKTLGASPAYLTLIDNKYDQYYLLDAAGDLTRATIGEPTPVAVLKGVINYKSFGTKRILYATAVDAPAGKVSIMILDGDKTYTIREVGAGTTYALDIADYRSSQYVVLAAASENIAYIYKDPINQLSDPKVIRPTAIRALRVPGVAFVSFSPSTRYIMGQNGSLFGVYDIFRKRAYAYDTKSPLDSPQPHAAWMDGDHLTYTAGGKQFVVDYDGRNPQTLMPASASQSAFFSQDYNYIFGFAPNASGITQLNRTGLRTAADL